MGTFFLVYCAVLIDERSLFFSDPSMKQYYDAFVSPFLVDWLVTALIVSMAGPKHTLTRTDPYNTQHTHAHTATHTQYSRYSHQPHDRSSAWAPSSLSTARS